MLGSPESYKAPEPAEVLPLVEWVLRPDGMMDVPSKSKKEELGMIVEEARRALSGVHGTGAASLAFVVDLAVESLNPMSLKSPEP